MAQRFDGMRVGGRAAVAMNQELVHQDRRADRGAGTHDRGAGGTFAEMKNRGVSILLVERKLTISLKVSQRLDVMGHGRIVFEGSPDELRANEAVREEGLEV